MKSSENKRLSLHERFDKFFIEPKFDVVKIDRLVKIVNEYIDEVPIHTCICGDVSWSIDDCEQADKIVKAIRKMLKGEK